MYARMGFAPGEGYPGGGESWDNWDDFFDYSYTQPPAGGGGGPAPLPCAQDDSFSRKHYPAFVEKARSTGIPAAAYWFGNIIVVDPSGQCRRVGNYPSNQAAVDFLKYYGVNVNPIWHYIEDPSPRWILYSEFDRVEGSGGSIVPTTGGGGGTIVPTTGGGGVILPPGTRTTAGPGSAQASIFDSPILWLGGGALLLMLVGRKK